MALGGGIRVLWTIFLVVGRAGCYRVIPKYNGSSPVNENPDQSPHVGQPNNVPPTPPSPGIIQFQDLLYFQHFMQIFVFAPNQ